MSGITGITTRRRPKLCRGRPSGAESLDLTRRLSAGTEARRHCSWKARRGAPSIVAELSGIGLREPRVHEWEKFVTPDELRARLEKHGLRSGGMKGLALRLNPLALTWTFGACAGAACPTGICRGRSASARPAT
jgi:hypothetical protein